MRKPLGVAAIFAIAALAACNGGTNPGGQLASVAALPVPKLPSWIAEISPTKTAQSLAQVRVIFAKPVTTVGALEGDGPADVLSHVQIAPQLAGKFVVLTPRMIGFVPAQALPVGTRVRVTLTAGLRDLNGDTLGDDLAWTFQTTALAFSGLPSLKADPDTGETPPPTNLSPTLKVTANAQVAAGSLASHVTLNGGGDSVPLQATLEVQATPQPGSGAQEAFDPSLKTWIYDLTPQSQLKKNTTYRLAIAPGVAPLYGNLPSSATFAGTIRTYDALSIGPSPAPNPGRFSPSDPVVAFNNAIDPKSLANNVTVVPAPAATDGLAKVSDNDPTTIAVNPYLLAPNTQYTVTLGAGIADVFGQTLGSGKTVTIRTGSFAPGFWAPDGTNVFAAGGGIALNYYATNLPGNRYRAQYRALTPGVIARSGGAYDVSALLSDWKNWNSIVIPGAKSNAQSTISVPLLPLLGAATGTVAYGAGTNTDSTSNHFGYVQITNLGVFAQIFPSHASAMVQRLSDGSPVGGVAISVYRIAPASDTPCATAVTDASGNADIGTNAIAPCYAVAADQYGSPSLMVVAAQGADWTNVLVGGNNSTIWNYGVDGTWTNGQPLSRGTIFSDRQMYQPGETARLTGIAYYVRDGSIVADKNDSYAVTSTDPNGAKKSLGSVQTDAFGTFSLSLPFARAQALGYYSLDAVGASGNTISGSLRVAEFKPPNFKLDVTLNTTQAAPGSAVTANATASYLFGAPLDGGKATVAITRSAATLAPPGWDDYTFGPAWFWPDQQPSFDTDVLQTSGTFDKGGGFVQKITVPNDLPFPMTYSVDIAASDVSNLSVDNTQAFTALPGDGTIGLKTDLVEQAGQPLNVSVVVTDLKGKTTAGKSVHLELQKMTYASATQMQSGGEDAQNSVQYTTVDTTDVTSGSSAVTAQLHPKDAGPYRIRANFGGASSDASATDLQAFVIGSGEANWGDQNATSTKIELDKKSYKVGDTATALVTSPFAQSDVYFMVIRHDVIWRSLVHANGNGPKVSFKITSAMLPNAAIEAVVVRRGTPLASVKAGTLNSLSRVGLAPITVDLGDRYLKVAVTPTHATLEPGAQQSVSVTLRDAAGHPATGEAVIMVVNDAILQLTGYRPPDLVQTVFASQPISTDFNDSRAHVILAQQTPVMEKGWGYGGGYLAGAGSTRVRTNFQPLAYYQVVRTDSSGRATVSFTLPDDLTTWRAMAVAIGSDDMHFGNGDATFVATKPLLTNALLPQFARPGDTIDGGLSVLAPNGGGSLNLTAQLTGALRFATGDPTSLQQTSNVGSTMQALTFPMIVGTPAPTTISFSSALGSATDAFRVPLDIRDRAIQESAIETGSTATQSSVPISLTSGGTLAVTLSNSAISQFAVPTSQAMAQDATSFADDAAARLTIAAATQQLAARYHLNPGYVPSAQIASALQSLAKLQRSDGGMGWFPNDTQSDPFASAAAATALAFAQARGVTVNGAMISSLRAYLARTLANPGSNGWCKNDLCRARIRFEALSALAAQGDRRTDFLSDIVAQRANFDSATQIRLARYLLATPGWQTQGAQQAASLEQTIYRTGRYANASSSDSWGWLGSTVDAQAQMLQLLLEQHANTDEIDGAVRALAAQKCGCGWPTIDDASSSMVAIAAYAATEKLVPFTATVSAGGSTLGSVSFGNTASSKTIDVPASSVHGSAVDVRASGGGTVRYVVLYTYNVPNNAPGQLAGLRVTRTVEPAGQLTPIATMDLAAITDPIAVSAGNVFDIGVRVVVDHPVDGVMIEDPIPAGMEAIDASFQTASTATLAQTDSWQIDSQQIYADRVTAYASHLEPGIYEVHYLVRSVTPGSYGWPGARAYLRAAPEQFGRSASAVLKVN